jgi:arylsulfatase A-like enzyme
MDLLSRSQEAERASQAGRHLPEASLMRLIPTMLAATAMLLCQTGIAQARAPAPPPVANVKPGEAASRPNILLIVADDLGWSDLGAFGGEIATPNLDKLALQGVRFTGWHTAPTCSPTRAMLMSGVDNHEAGLGTMAEMLTPNEEGKPGYEGYLNDRVASIAELLRQGGYHTMMAGKWHLGLTPERSPAARGFDRSFALLQGLGNHFGADQNDAWGKVERATYREGRKEVPFPAGAYSTDLFTGKLLGFLAEPRAAGQPFFAYLPFSAPHWPLMAPDVDIAKYKGRYDEGYDVLAAKRLAREKQLGLVPADAKPHAMVGVKPWTQLTAQERADGARRMEVYAAMVDHLDRAVGRVIEQLRASGELDNTLIVFTADNGPEGGIIDSPRKVATDAKALATLKIDNSIGNIGHGTSYVGYGPGWAQANSAPSWLVKGYTTEGGIRTSAFITGKGVSGGRIVNSFVHITDVAPTLLAEAGLTEPASFAGHPILPYEGKSLVPLIGGATKPVHGDDELIAWELFDGRAIRRGNWKAVYLAPGSSRYLMERGNGQWKLFDLSRDPGENTDLAAQQPALLKDLVDAWGRYAKAKGVVLPPPADSEKPADHKQVP